jgi:sugar transferase (PEP-CTERM/EpsH1 system associated)
MNILVFASEVPATPGMAGSPRLFSLCRGLSQRHRLTLATYSQSEERYRSFLADPASAGVFADMVLLPGPPEPGWWGRQRHRLRQEAHFGIRLRTPTYHAEQCRRIRETVVKEAIDVLFVDGLSNAQYVLPDSLPCPAVIDLHDSVTLLYTRKTRMEPHWLRRQLLRAETRSIARWERGLGRTFATVLTNSPVDEEFLRTLAPDTNTRTIGNGVDSDFFQPSGPSGDLSRLVFTGVLGYGPNEDAVVYFCESILPLIHRENPAVTFSAVGKDPSDRVKALQGLRGVEIVGTVPDVRPHLERAGIFVCPLRWGAGVKNKLLAALAMGKPVVATPQSIDGLDLKDEEHLLLAGAPTEFAAKVLRLVNDPAEAQRLARAGREFVVARYSWERSARELEDTLCRAVASHPRRS